ncbi:hypothetical protein BDN72DRAFT_246797 [Pluteus cervinus]|uniref:Uncharacterized protein n=1 Tax=Pluteus cervinus TaxID=181527 RepID=A0ACD3B7Z3_9AGAR|nr:hypothetical protein BDN72DRAFT_246797 [Pluteus cervinus]
MLIQLRKRRGFGLISNGLVSWSQARGLVVHMFLYRYPQVVLVILVVVDWSTPVSLILLRGYRIVAAFLICVASQSSRYQQFCINSKDLCPPCAVPWLTTYIT